MTTTEPTMNLPAVRMGSLADKVDYAQHLASSALLPRQYQKQPANLLFAIEYAEMLQLPPMAAITGIHVIEGKPSASAALISALVRRAGHRLRVTGNDQRAVAQIVRSDDPEFTFESEWTLDRAKAAGLVGKDVWKKYPAAMLKARAISEVARDACEEALSGMHYTPEELGAEVDGDGEIVVEQVRDERPAHRPGMTLREAAGQPTQDYPAPEGPILNGANPVSHENPTPTAGDIPDAEIVQDKPERGTITDAQIKKLGVQMKTAGITERKEALDYVMSIIGRDVASRNELSKDEASKVIDKLDQLIRTEAGATDTATGEVIDAEIVPDAAAAEADKAWQSGGAA
ncbi:hypothetical protein ACFPJ1_40470 [Kribbella qitaiheensis]|uniref:hypothetical protein n=1 Tax=Kribbella qitaiheensis TaxID=1544730 RepID=UPI00361FA8C5